METHAGPRITGGHEAKGTIEEKITFKLAEENGEKNPNLKDLTFYGRAHEAIPHCAYV